MICSTAYIQPRPFLPPEEHLSGFAAQTFIRSIDGRPVLILAAENDDFNCTVEQAHHLFQLIEGENKKIVFYDSKHRLPREHAPVAVDWLVKTLK